MPAERPWRSGWSEWSRRMCRRRRPVGGGTPLPLDSGGAEAAEGFTQAVSLFGQVAPRSLTRGDQQHLLGRDFNTSAATAGFGPAGHGRARPGRGGQRLPVRFSRTTGNPGGVDEPVQLDGLTPGAVRGRLVEFMNAMEGVPPSPPTERAAEKILTDMLGWLWDTVAGPVLDRLGITGRPPEGEPWPRVWWCLSGCCHSCRCTPPATTPPGCHP